MMNAVAASLRPLGVAVNAYGCSVTGKVAYWAAVTSETPYEIVFVDSGGAFGPASLKDVGPCGETWRAMLGRWPSWLAPNASALLPPAEWPRGVDVGSLMLSACRATHFVFSTGRADLWNNPDGTLRTVRVARAAGCDVQAIVGSGALHCGYFDAEAIATS